MSGGASRVSMALALVMAAAPLTAQMPMKAQQNAQPAMPMPRIGDPALPTPEFLRTAMQSDEFEIREGRLALKMAHDPRLKAFASRMIRDHTKSTAEIKAAVTGAGMGVPPAPPLTPEQQHMIASTTGMASMGGFDADYVNDQVMAHRAALAVMTNYAKGGSSAPIRQAVAKIVPVVRGHLQTIEQIQRSMPKGAM